MPARPMLKSVDIFNEIIDSLNQYVSHSPSNEFAKAGVFAHVEGLATELKELDVALGFAAFGSIACAKGNVPEMHRNHKLSIKYRADALMFVNYAKSLQRCGNYQDSLSYAKVAYDVVQDEVNALDVLGFLVYVTDLAKEINMFLRYSTEWEKLTGKRHALYEDYLESLKEAEVLSDFCTTVSEPSLSAVWDTAEEDQAWAHLQ